jgi:hypothetical protein
LTLLNHLEPPRSKNGSRNLAHTSLALAMKVEPPAEPREGGSMGRPAAAALYVAAMAALVVGVDVLFFRGHVWERLAANVGIVLVFVAFYFRFLRHA